MPYALNCPACGGAVAKNAAACSYCGNHLALLRCPMCATQHFVGAKHCTQCKHLLRAAPRGEVQATQCPHCHKRLVRTRFGDNEADTCEQCAGLFLTHEVLEALMHARERAAVVSRSAARPIAVPDMKVRYIKCPVCQHMMNRLNFARRSGIIVDVCAVHGTWFDAGELALALQYVARGGRLQATDLVRQEQLRAERQQRFASAPIIEDSTPPGNGLVRTLADVMGAVLLGLFD